jgi:hypothetical protein
VKWLSLRADIRTRNVAQAFQPAGSGDFPVPRRFGRNWGQESPQNPQTEMSVLRFMVRGNERMRTIGYRLHWPRGTSPERPCGFEQLHLDSDGVEDDTTRPNSIARFDHSGFHLL